MTPSIVQAGIGVVIAATLGGCATVGGGGLTSGDACDRDCLLATLDAHLAAVAANDPSHARLAPVAGRKVMAPQGASIRTGPLQGNTASGRNPGGILSRPSQIRSAMTAPTIGAMPNPILKPPLAI